MANNNILVESNLLTTHKNSSVKQKNIVDNTAAAGSAAKSVSPQASADVAKSSQDDQKKAQKSNLDDKVSKLNDYMQSLNRSLRFSIDKNTDDIVVKVVDSKTNQLIRQIPSQEMLDIQQAAEKYRGIIFEKKA